MPAFGGISYRLLSGLNFRFCPQSNGKDSSSLYGFWRIANLRHKRPMIWPAGDLGIEIDFGSNKLVYPLARPWLP